MVLNYVQIWVDHICQFISDTTVLEKPFGPLHLIILVIFALHGSEKFCFLMAITRLLAVSWFLKSDLPHRYVPVHTWNLDKHKIRIRHRTQTVMFTKMPLSVGLNNNSLFYKLLLTTCMGMLVRSTNYKYVFEELYKLPEQLQWNI